MKKLVLGVAIFAIQILLLAGCTAHFIFASTPAADAYAVPRSEVVALVDATGGNGSGVIIAPNTILTARHVAAQILAGNKLWIEPGHIPVTVERVGTGDVDLAILHAKVACPCAPIAATPATVDEPLIVVGYPVHKFVNVQVLTHGDAQGTKDAYLMATADVAGGNSGGGVFLRRHGRWVLAGVLIGVVNGTASSIMGTIAVPTHYLSVAINNATVRAFLSGKLSQAAADYHPDTGTL